MAETQDRANSDRATVVLDLFDLYYDRVYAFLRKSTTPDVAEDLSQEVFVRLLQHPELERLTISISYLLKIAHNLLRRRYARAARLRELLEERAMEAGDWDADAGAPALPESVCSDSVLETAMGLLSRDEQDAIRLIVCEGKSYQHAAEALGVSVSTINNWKHRGVAKLRKLVSEPAAACEPPITPRPISVASIDTTPASGHRFSRSEEPTRMAGSSSMSTIRRRPCVPRRFDGDVA